MSGSPFSDYASPDPSERAQAAMYELFAAAGAETQHPRAITLKANQLVNDLIDAAVERADAFAYRRGWEDGKNAALRAATAPVIADSDDIERELVRVSHLATAPVSADLDDVDGLDDIPEFLRQRQARANGGRA